MSTRDNDEVNGVASDLNGVLGNISSMMSKIDKLAASTRSKMKPEEQVKFDQVMAQKKKEIADLQGLTEERMNQLNEKIKDL